MPPISTGRRSVAMHGNAAHVRCVVCLCAPGMHTAAGVLVCMTVRRKNIACHSAPAAQPLRGRSLRCCQPLHMIGLMIWDRHGADAYDACWGAGGLGMRGRTPTAVPPSSRAIARLCSSARNLTRLCSRNGGLPFRGWLSVHCAACQGVL